MTPQTLVNDLVKENCDAKDIVLLVVGELYLSKGRAILTPFPQTKRTGQQENTHTTKPYVF